MDSNGTFASTPNFYIHMHDWFVYLSGLLSYGDSGVLKVWAQQAPKPLILVQDFYVSVVRWPQVPQTFSPLFLVGEAKEKLPLRWK